MMTIGLVGHSDIDCHQYHRGQSLRVFFFIFHRQNWDEMTVKEPEI